MSPTYAERFSSEEIARHAALAGQLDEDRLAVVDARPAGARRPGEVSVVAYDFPGELR